MEPSLFLFLANEKMLLHNRQVGSTTPLQSTPLLLHIYAAARWLTGFDFAVRKAWLVRKVVSVVFFFNLILVLFKATFFWLNNKDTNVLPII